MARAKAAETEKRKATRLREVAVENPPLRLVYVDPRSLDENPLNWKRHTDFQSEVVGELLQKHGWILPLAYNLETGRLLDGHDRRKIAIAKGLPFVPVVVGTWPEGQEAEILASLDPSGALAKGDPEALERLLSELEDPSPLIDRFITQMAESNGLLERLAEDQPVRIEPTFAPDTEALGPADFGDRVDDFPPTGPAPGPRESPPIPHYESTPSHVRMLQLYLDTETLPEMRKMIAALQDVHGTDTETDTVLAVMREAYRGLPGEG